MDGIFRLEIGLWDFVVNVIIIGRFKFTFSDFVVNVIISEYSTHNLLSPPRPLSSLRLGLSKFPPRSPPSLGGPPLPENSLLCKSCGVLSITLIGNCPFLDHI